jgi:hypothetical protein
MFRGIRRSCDVNQVRRRRDTDVRGSVDYVAATGMGSRTLWSEQHVVWNGEWVFGRAVGTEWKGGFV